MGRGTQESVGLKALTFIARLWERPRGLRHMGTASPQAYQIALLYLKAKEENKPQPKEEAILALNKRNVFYPAMKTLWSWNTICINRQFGCKQPHQ